MLTFFKININFFLICVNKNIKLKYIIHNTRRHNTQYVNSYGDSDLSYYTGGSERTSNRL